MGENGGTGGREDGAPVLEVTILSRRVTMLRCN